MNVPVSVLTLALVCLSAAPATASGIDSEARLEAVRPPTAATALEVSHKPQAGFEANSGQMDPRVRFVARLGDRTAFVTATDLVVTSAAGTERTEWSGPAGPPHLEAAGRRVGTSNWFLGNDPARWKRGAAVFEAVALRDVAPGVDVVVSATGTGVRWELVAKSGADLSSVRVLRDGGSIRVASYQKGPSGSRPLPARLGRGEDGAWFVRHGAVEPGAEIHLVAEPAEGEIDALLTARGAPVGGPNMSTFLGGTDSDIILDVAVEPDGTPWVAGFTFSADFPTESAWQGFNAGVADAIVAKLAPGGLGLFESTYFGGSDFDAVYAMAFDVYGGVVIAGYTASTDLPAIAPFQATNNGSGDGFVARLLSDGSQIEFSTYIGGSGSDLVLGVATGPLGEIAVAGATGSTDYPIVAPGHGPFGGFDGTLSVFTQAGGLAHSTLFGGPFADFASNVVFDGVGSIYVTNQQDAPGGTTMSIDRWSTALLAGPSLGLGLDPARSPVLNGLARGPNGIVAAGTVLQTGAPKDRGGLALTDLLVVQVPFDLSSAQFRTLGGVGVDIASDVAVDPDGRIFVAGSTASASDFPIVNPFQAGYGGGERDALFVEVSPSDLSIVQSSFIGGEAFDSALGIEVDSLGNIVLGGETGSNAFPVTPNAYQATRMGNYDGFLVRLLSRGEQPIYQLDWFAPAIPSETELTPARGLSAQPGATPAPPPQARGGPVIFGAYNIYRSNTPGVVPSAKTYYKTVASYELTTGPTVAGGAHFVITAVYPTGESQPTNEASAGAGEATIDSVLARQNKLMILGSGFSSTATVTVDGIAFSLPSKVKAGGTKVVQKGRLSNGQTPLEYLISAGGAGVLTVRNASGATATVRLRFN